MILPPGIAHVTLRQLQPQWDLDQSWEEENLDVAVKRTLNLIHIVTIKKKELFTALAFLRFSLYKEDFDII